MDLAVRLRRCSDPRGGRHSSRGSHKLPSWTRETEKICRLRSLVSTVYIIRCRYLRAFKADHLCFNTKSGSLFTGRGDPELQPCGSHVDRSGAEGNLLAGEPAARPVEQCASTTSRVPVSEPSSRSPGEHVELTRIDRLEPQRTDTTAQPC